MVRFSFFIASFTAAPLHAQSGADPPLVGRPPQFSGIVGRYHITTTATPTTVAVEAPLTLRVTIQGNGPVKYQPDRKRLKLFPERWARDFYVEPVPDADRHAAGSDTWEFVFRLRPRHRKIAAIDGIKLVYYEPGNNGGRYQTDYADPIDITVQPRRPRRHSPTTCRCGPRRRRSMSCPRPKRCSPPPVRHVSPWLLVGLLIAPPLVTLAGVRVWRRVFPDAFAKRQRERSRAARRTVAALADEPAWVVLGRYLQERLDFPAVEPTPADVRRFLRRRTSRPVAEKLAAFLGSCAAARFAPVPADRPDVLRDEARRLIQTLEDDLCA